MSKRTGIIRFAQFYRRNAFGLIAPMIGGDSVALLDMRHKMETSAAIARSLARSRKAQGFDIREGESFTRSRVVWEREVVVD